MSKIFVDSKFRTPESRSGSDFTIELLEPLMLPPECKVRVTNLTCPVSWWTIDTPNQHLYFSEKNPDNSIRYHVAVLPRGMYNGPQLASTIASVMNPLSVYGPLRLRRELQRQQRSHHCYHGRPWGAGDVLGRSESP